MGFWEDGQTLDPGDTVPESNHPENHEAHSGTGWEPVRLSLLDDLPSDSQERFLGPRPQLMNLLFK